MISINHFPNFQKDYLQHTAKDVAGKIQDYERFKATGNTPPDTHIKDLIALKTAEERENNKYKQRYKEIVQANPCKVADEYGRWECQRCFQRYVNAGDCWDK